MIARVPLTCALDAFAMAHPKRDSECVRVVVRIRPMSEKERQDARKVVVSANEERGEITITPASSGEGAEDPKTFTFDRVYGMNCTQKQIYDHTAAQSACIFHFFILERLPVPFNYTPLLQSLVSRGLTSSCSLTSSAVRASRVLPLCR